ncbi:single-stranded-DNA-specific exonuclease RecJ [Cohnella zeiphila]|uniref:Single-stranded-DNA-specific exonuclease RecJ n=1 Tax=Cohnella zeiphila TaxID=2761120 RepID=A0A7X0VT00_9BACL|nr:single-stranded-DNA-specific exonuclease RecJ [Cohnella zeiphila]MBB6729354.1 single-stranded-DNA-specific exonuclease RecJ [Cohnella zeiphila]
MKRKYRWEMREADPQAAEALAAELKLPPLVARLLASRGLTEPEDARRFLYGGSEGFHDPYRMKGMAEAVERIRRALRDREKIRVYGDYDADGVTSTALMIRLLGRLEADFDTYIPHRSREGYGLHTGAIDLAAAAGVKLIVTVDNGISAVEQIAYARSLGIEVVVTDHHEPPAVLPEAAALVNPKQPGCGYPFKGLSGAGVAFKLAHALLAEADPSYADLAAIGTVADLMPLEDENRILVKLGLERMNVHPTAGIRALAAICGAEQGKLTSGRIAFALAPRLNAGGRLESADGAVKLLVADSDAEADELAQRLDELNKERQQLVDETVLEADRLWLETAEQSRGEPCGAIVLAGEGWNAGIAGLVASKLVERYYRPTVILAIDPATGMCKGSARSIEGFDLHAALTECADLLDHFGGHQAAAGMTMRTELVPELGRRLSEIALERIRPDDWLPKRKADLRIRPAEWTLETAEMLKLLEPCGNGNPTPRFVVKEAKVQEARAIGKTSKHLRLVIEDQGRRLETVGFGMGEETETLSGVSSVDLLGELAVNEWNGSRRVQLMLQDWKPNSLPIFDRRSERSWLAGAESLAARGAGLLILCSTSAALQEAAASETLAAAGAAAFGYEQWRGWTGKAGTLESTAETAASSALRVVPGPERERHLVLAGLPKRPGEVGSLRELFAEGHTFESIHIFAAEAGETGGRTRPFPDREQFGRVYSLFRRQGSWIDTPDGFLRQAAEATGWPLATVRMMQDVFEELGFLSVDRASVKVAATPARRELEQSERYRKAKEHAEAAALPAMNTESLRQWLRGLLSAAGARQ